jgi:hypothetical protein
VTFTLVDGVADPAGIPTEFALDQNYPNPFNPTTQIRFALPEACTVTLKIYDILSREIAVVVNEQKGAGEYVVEWNAQNQPSGIYYYRLQAGSFSEVKRMLLVK